MLLEKIKDVVNLINSSVLWNELVCYIKRLFECFSWMSWVCNNNNNYKKKTV